MSRANYLFRSDIHDYMLANTLREPDILRRLREETATHERAIMQIPAEQGQFLALLVKMLGARNTLEIGVFTGYSSLAVALALPAGGKIVACDISEEYTSVARRYWAEAGVGGKIDLRIAPASDTLRALVTEGRAGTFDFAFIDADKTGYAQYYELALTLLRPGGLIAVDNVLQSGRLLDPANNDPDTVAIREFNHALLGDARVDVTMLALADGLTLALKN